MKTIAELISQMTLEEKAGLCSGADSWRTKAVPRLGIPAFMMSDGPHGLRAQRPDSDDSNESIQAVCFPAGCAAAASFDTELIGQEGQVLGQQCRDAGVNMLLGPAINIKRSPLCGRNFEYYSEDPYLAGELAAAFIQGVQSKGVGTSVKHFAANNQEFRRMSVSSQMDERTLQEIYLPAFEAAVRKAQPWTVMCSYNRLNGEYMSENKALLEDTLRSLWGFEGVVVSDWGAVNDRVRGIKAGLELEMPSSNGVNDAKIVRAVQDGTLEEAVLDKAVARLLNMILRAADLAPKNAESPGELDIAAGHAFAAEMETQCAVLLKNKGVLPLYSDTPVAYIGGFADTPRIQGGGSSHINTKTIVSPLAVAKEKGRAVTYAAGFPAQLDERNEEAFIRAVEAARTAQVAVVFAGLPDSFESEGYDRKNMRLPECQNNLIARIAAVQPNTVVVLQCGSPVECPWADDVAAVLCMYLGGEGVGEAADALLYGEANPAGRLPESWPLRLEDTPCYLEFPGDGKKAQYTEGVYVGYRWYDARRMEVRWPFGHGLSYTGFVYREPRLSANEMAEGETVTVTLKVCNTGTMAGQEVVQLYVADKTETMPRPVRELKGFTKISLQPGEEKTVSFTVDSHTLSYFDEALGDWYAAPGQYQLQLGHSSRDIHATLDLTYHTQRRRPLQIDENTVLADLQQDPRTAPVVQQLAEDFMGQFGGGTEAPDSDSAAVQAITPEMVNQMMLNSPLRTLRSFGGLTDERLDAILAALRAAAAK